MKRNQRLLLPALMAALLAAPGAIHAGLRKISVQGKLTNAAGTALTGTLPVTFRLYPAATGGTALWTSGALNVTAATGGLFNVPLQDGTPSLDGLSFDTPYYLGVAVGADPEMTPRQELGASALSHGSPNDFQVKNNLIVTAGKLGIGTTAPASKLHVSNAAYPQIHLDDNTSRTFALGVTAATLRIRDVTGAADRMTIDAGGNVGLGTATPGAKLTIENGDLTLQGGSTRIIAGTVGMMKLQNTADIAFIADTDTDSSGSFAFITGPNERMRIVNNGNVGIGTAAPGVKLEVVGDVRASGVYYSSDRLLKKNIQPLPADTLAKIAQLNGVSYEWDVDAFKRKYSQAAGSATTLPPVPGAANAALSTIGASGQEVSVSTAPQIGLIAQDVEAQFPALVITDADGVKAVDYGKFSAVLLEAVKAQQKQIQALEQRLQAVERK